ncbi:MAG: hypothetical protein NUV44_07255 [Candidatus Scalindua sp.]|nr:hypothetical protein [Candidatus Scalindua sp.]
MVIKKKTATKKAVNKKAISKTPAKKKTTKKAVSEKAISKTPAKKKTTKKAVSEKAISKTPAKKKAPTVKKDLDQIIKQLRKNPKVFTALSKKFKTAKTDEKRMKILFDFAIDSKGLRRILPKDMQPGGQAFATVTTVTVTTVTIPDTAY